MSPTRGVVPWYLIVSSISEMGISWRLAGNGGLPCLCSYHRSFERLDFVAGTDYHAANSPNLRRCRGQRCLLVRTNLGIHQRKTHLLLRGSFRVTVNAISAGFGGVFMRETVIIHSRLLVSELRGTLSERLRFHSDDLVYAHASDYPTESLSVY